MFLSFGEEDISQVQGIIDDLVELDKNTDEIPSENFDLNFLFPWSYFTPPAPCVPCPLCLIVLHRLPDHFPPRYLHCALCGRCDFSFLTSRVTWLGHVTSSNSRRPLLLFFQICDRFCFEQIFFLSFILVFCLPVPFGYHREKDSDNDSRTPLTLVKTKHETQIKLANYEFPKWTETC